MPLYTSDLIRYFAWRTILGTHGLMNDCLLSLGIVGEPLQIFAFNPFAVIVSLVHVYLPFMTLAIWVSLESIDQRLIEAAMDLGARPWTAFRSVTLQLSTPGLVAGSLFVFVPVSGEYFSMNLLGGTTGYTITNVINDQFSSAINWPFGASLSFTLLFFVGIFLFLFFMLISRSSFARNYLRRGNDA